MRTSGRAAGRGAPHRGCRVRAISPECADAYLLLAEEAAATLEQALKLLEQGVAAGERAEYLLSLELHDELEDLFATDEEDGEAAFAYTKALATFRRAGDSPGARELLAQVREMNLHVPAYLSGHKRLPARLPDYVGFGRHERGIDYAAARRTNGQACLAHSCGSQPEQPLLKGSRSLGARSPEPFPERLPAGHVHGCGHIAVEDGELFVVGRSAVGG